MTMPDRSARAFAPPLGFAFHAAVEHHGAGTTFVVARGGERFVCKRLSARMRHDGEARLRLVDEGRILDALAGRGAPRLVAQGDDAAGPFVVMEQIAMPTLEVLAHAVRGALLDHIARSALGALAMVHDAADARGPLDIVHADVSPTNLLVAADGGSAALIDFGMARWRDGLVDAPSAFRGTLQYAAPELARGERFDARADLFALAASLIHAASATAPRPALAPPALLVLAGDTPIDGWARREAAAFSSPVARALVACTAHSPEERPASARAALARAMCAE